MTWIVKIDGNEVSSDDFLLGDLAWIEKQTGSFWSILNPWKNADQARAFIRVALIRSGISEEDAEARCDALTLKDIKGAFDYIEESNALEGGSGKAPDRQARTSRSSSPGARRSSGGRQKNPADSGSETSSS